MAMLGTILTVVGGIGMLIFAVQMLIMAFKTSIGWGLASLFIPFVLFVYAFKNWGACKTPFMRWLGSFVVWAVGFGITMFGVASTAMSTPVQ
ncbi:MAG: hypothetical protein ABI609_08245 [Acidobacteriota bacterium]